MIQDADGFIEVYVSGGIQDQNLVFEWKKFDDDGVTLLSLMLLMVNIWMKDQMLKMKNKDGFTDILSGGSYQLQVTDANSCSITLEEYEIKEPDLLSIYSYQIPEYNGYNLKCNGNKDSYIHINLCIWWNWQ